MTRPEGAGTLIGWTQAIPPAVHAILERNRAALRERLDEAARRVGRDPAQVRLVAVTKSQPAPVALALREIGQQDLAENRLEGLLAKRAHFEQAGATARWHFVGRLQRNKARRVLLACDEIHSVDRDALLDNLARLAAEEDVQARIYLQVELAGDGRKAGYAPDELRDALQRAHEATHLAPMGLMTMAALPEGAAPAERARAASACFARLAELGRELPASQFAEGAPRLSMGMSGDFEQAVEQGATDVRLGRSLFSGIDAPSSQQEGAA